MRTGTARRKTARPILITGSTGTLGSAFGRMCERRGLAYRLLSRQEMDIADPASVDGALDGLAPWAVINAAGYVRVDDAEREQERCFRENTHGPSVLAECCARRGIGLLAFSSDLVFDGETRVPYVESDRTAPLGVYGRSKAEAEERVLASLPDALVVRTSSFFGPWDRHNFLTSALSTLAQRQPFRAAHDTVVSPTYVPDLVNACLDLLVDGESGIWHLANAGAISWFELAQRAAEMVGLDTRLVEGCATHCLGYSAPRPRYSALDSKRANLLPSLDNALDRYIHESGAPMFCN
jgi:dTDP-4-dehydrorhamnose reductase